METASPAIERARATRILIGEDQPHVAEALRLLLKGEGYQAVLADSPGGVLACLAAGEFDAALVDLNYTRDTTSGREGLELVTRMHEFDSTLPVVVMTAWGSVELAMQAVHRGASDFVQKPWSNDRLLELLRAQVEQGRQTRRQRRRREDEADEAGRIQRGLLPREIPQAPGYEIAATWQPARTVGGDYFDVLRIGSRYLGLVIADVVGKGLPAALLMSNLQAAVRAACETNPEPTDLCDRVERLIGPNLPANRFVTLFYGLLDTVEHTLRFCNAGHNPPLLARSGAEVIRLNACRPVVGVASSYTGDPGEVRLLPGDRLLLYTDGLAERVNDDGEEFGERGLFRVLREQHGRSAEATQRAVLSAAALFGSGRFLDDAALIVVTRGTAAGRPPTGD